MLHLHHQYFTTCTILEWYHLLASDTYKNMIIDSFRYFVKEGSVEIYAFVIMTNHLHIVWQINEPFELHKIQHRFLKFTAQRMKFTLQMQMPEQLERFWVNKADRKYQIWQRCSMSKLIFTKYFWWQKVNYIHLNPCRSKPQLAKHPTDYKYSSALYYESGIKNWDFLADRFW